MTTAIKKTWTREDWMNAEIKTGWFEGTPTEIRRHVAQLNAKPETMRVRWMTASPDMTRQGADVTVWTKA